MNYNKEKKNDYISGKMARLLKQFITIFVRIFLASIKL